MFGLGLLEVSAVLTLFGTLGLPLGVPPAAENPAMQHVAPAECLFYTTWAAMAQPDGKNPNHTEQLFAEPEVQTFLKSLDASLAKGFAQAAAEAPDEKSRQAAEFGPRFARKLLTHSTALFITRFDYKEEKVLFEGGLLIDAGADAAALAKSLVELASIPELARSEVTIAGTKFTRFAPPPAAPVLNDMTVGAMGNYLLIGWGKNSVEGMVERLRVKKTHVWLSALQARLPVERRSSMTYINTKAIVDKYLPLAGPEAEQIATSLGVKQLGALETVTGLDKEGMVTRTFLKIDGDPKGLLTLLGGAGIKPEQVKFIPKDATFATAVSLNGGQVMALVEALTKEYAPEGVQEIEGAAAQFQATFGLRFKEDFLASLGDVWTLSWAAPDGWLGFVASVEVRDRDKLATLMKNAEALLSDVPAEEEPPRILTSKFEGHDLKMLAIPGVPLRPAWTLTKDRLIIALTPQTIKSSLTLRPEELGLLTGPRFESAYKGDGQTIMLSYQDTAKLFETVYGYVTLIVPMMAEMSQEFGLGGPPELGADSIPFDFATLPSGRSIQRHLRPGISIVRRTKDGVESETRNTVPVPSIGASAPILVALLLPAVEATRQAARRNQSITNIRQLGIGLVTYENTHRKYPPAASVKGGKKLLSWRVHILPYIDEGELYDQFKLDEPWDSEHNKKLIDKMPAVFRSPNGKVTEPGKTTYLAPIGKGTIFAKDGPTKTVEQIVDGTSRTIMLVEANPEKAVIWTKPEDLDVDMDDPLAGLGDAFPGGFPVVFADNHTQFIAATIDKELFRYYLQADDGNAVPGPFDE